VPQSEIRCIYTDPKINARLSELPTQTGSYSRHFNQVEEFFLRLEGEFTVPQLPIHHDVRNLQPEPGYLRLLGEVLEQLGSLAPQVFRRLSYLFDPSDILRPGFYRCYSHEQMPYLYLVRLNLTYRPLVHRVVLKGDNDHTAAYASRDLHLEATFIPLREVEEGAVGRFLIDETISNTWVTQTGRGYFVQGIWMDNDLTRFFSKLLLPPGLRSYPYYPYLCRYRTVCQSVICLDAEARERLLPGLHRALDFLRPVMPRVEQSLRGGSFSETDPLYEELKARVPVEWYEIWRGLRVETYLNEADMKEYRVEHSPG
jgi:hypothetical protein